VLPTRDRDRNSCDASTWQGSASTCQWRRANSACVREKSSKGVHRVSRVLGVHKSRCIVFYEKMGCIHFSFSTCVAAFSTGWNTAHLFLWRYFNFLFQFFFNIYNVFSIIINKKNSRRIPRTMSAKSLISRPYFMDRWGHFYAKWRLILITFWFGKMRIRMLFDRVSCNIGDR